MPPWRPLFNYLFKHQYLIYNDQTEALLKFLVKVINDNEYQPNGAYEQLFEQRLIDAHNKVQKEIREGKYPGLPADYEMDYESSRSDYAQAVYDEMSQYIMIKEK